MHGRLLLEKLAFLCTTLHEERSSYPEYHTVLSVIQMFRTFKPSQLVLDKTRCQCAFFHTLSSRARPHIHSLQSSTPNRADSSSNKVEVEVSVSMEYCAENVQKPCLGTMLPLLYMSPLQLPMPMLCKGCGCQGKLEELRKAKTGVIC